MKKVLSLTALYNKQTNAELYELLAGQERELLDRECGSYFSSIKGLLNHVLAAEVEFSRGDRKFKFILGKIFLHLMNRATHHRGAISQILDEWGADNDYSNLMRLLM